MDVDEIFVDTNILIFATNSASAWHAPAATVLQNLHQQGITLAVSFQVLREYLAASTRFSGQDFALDTILANLHTFQTQFHLLEENELVFAHLMNLVSHISVAGKQIHDANIVATMQAYGISHLLTHNVNDFKRFAGLITIVPLIK